MKTTTNKGLTMTSDYGTVTFAKVGRLYTRTNSLGETLSGLTVAEVREMTRNLYRIGFRPV